MGISTHMETPPAKTSMILSSIWAIISMNQEQAGHAQPSQQRHSSTLVIIALATASTAATLI